MNESQATRRKIEPKSLERALGKLYKAEPSPEDRQRANIRLSKTMTKAKQNAILYGQLEHTIIDNLFLATRNNEVVAIHFGIVEDEFFQQIENQFKAPVYFAPKETEEAIQQLQAYLNGQRTNFDLPTDISILTEFQQQVLQATQQIPRG